MRLVTYDRGGVRRLGALVAGTVVDLPDAVGHPSFPATMEALVAYHGGTTLHAAAFALARPEAVETCAVPEPRLLVPIIPTSLREFTGTPATNGNRRVLGPDEEIAWPTAARYLGCELEVACIVGRHGRKLSRARATSGRSKCKRTRSITSCKPSNVFFHRSGGTAPCARLRECGRPSTSGGDTKTSCRGATR